MPYSAIPVKLRCFEERCSRFTVVRYAELICAVIGQRGSQRAFEKQKGMIEMKGMRESEAGFYIALGKSLRQIRTTARGRIVSQSELAAALKTTPNTISRWESGIYRPSAADLDSIARFFGVPVGLLFPNAEPLSPQAALGRIALGLPQNQALEIIHYVEIRRAINTWKGESPQDIRRVIEEAMREVVMTGDD